MTADRPNLFILLELDPNAPWDEAAYRHALNTKRHLWTRLSTGPQSLPATADAKRHLGLIKEKTFDRVMEDADERHEERNRARKEKQAALTARRKDFEARLLFLEKRGHLLAPEAESLRDGFADVLATERALAKRLDKIPVRPIQADPSEAVLDESTAAQLRDMLTVARVRSIYDALRSVDPRINHQSPCGDLLEAAVELYRKEQGRKNKADPAIKARERLSGMAKKIFATDELRARHDAWMRLTEVEKLIDWVVEVLGAAKAISAAQVEAFLKMARDRGIDDLDLALQHLRQRLVQRGWAIELPTATTEKKLRSLVRCPVCAELNEPSDQVCRVCTFALREPCPSCGAIAPQYGGGCRCGFPIGRRDTVTDLIVQAGEALDAGRQRTAESLLDQAERIWRLPDGSDDQVLARLQRTRARWRDTVRRIEKTDSAITKLTESRMYVQAADLLRAGPPGLTDREARLHRAEAVIAAAQKRFEQAKQPGVPTSRRVELLSEALRLCADLDAAHAELVRIPPEAPHDVRATVADPAAGVLVDWAGPAEPGVSYLVIRRIGFEPPQSAEDLPEQRRVGEVDGPPWRDRRAIEVAGLPLTYAVIAVRSGTFSAPGVAEPVVVALDPELRCEAGDGRVTLTWDMPKHADRIEMTRREVGGSDPAMVLETTTCPSLIDADVDNGIRYEYTARVAYAVTGREAIWSPGRSEQVTPTTPPAPPGPLILSGSPPSAFGLYDHRVDIRFPPPRRGEVWIIRQEGAGSLREGDHGPAATFRPDGYELHGSQPLSDSILDSAPGCFSYVPVLSVDDMRYVGRPRRYAIHAEVSDLQGDFAGKEFLLGWSWPDGARRALVGYRTTGELLDATAADRRLRVDREPDGRMGACVLPVRPGDTAMFVVVALVVERDGLDFVTSGTRDHVTRPRHRVTYQVRRSVGRRPKLVLESSQSVGLPDLLLLGRLDRPPRTRADGDVIMSIGARDVSDEATVTLPQGGHRELHYRLFTKTYSDAASVELVPL